MTYDSHSGSLNFHHISTDRSFLQPEKSCGPTSTSGGTRKARSFTTFATKPGRRLQRTHAYRAELAQILRVPESHVRVVAGDIGGSFGMKSAIYNEVALVLFASKLTGKIDRITLPQRGQWLRQGQKICTVYRDGNAVDMVSPIEGSVADINETVARDPKLALRDPYGEGWLVTVQSPDAKTNFRNLLGGALARWWTEESASRLQRKMPMALGALAQDGGVAMDDATAHIPGQDWMPIAKEFFLS